MFEVKVRSTKDAVALVEDGVVVYNKSDRLDSFFLDRYMKKIAEWDENGSRHYPLVFWPENMEKIALEEQGVLR